VRLSEIYKIADEIAPKRLSDEYCARYGAYDNSGILVDAGEEIKGVLFTLDLTFAAIERAKGIGANLIICHHPAIYGKISDIRIND
jgi:putative NIF3 family GTP cyclohydrolase 1 type 2